MYSTVKLNNHVTETSHKAEHLQYIVNCKWKVTDVFYYVHRNYYYIYYNDYIIKCSEWS